LSRDQIGKPHSLSLNPDGLPLRDLQIWVGWRWVFRRGVWSKVLVDLRTGSAAKSNDPSTWVSLPVAVERYQKQRCDGIGACRTEDYVFVDLDGATDEQGNPRTFPWVGRTINLLRGRGYCARSASGRGLHFIVRGKVPPGRRQFEMPAPPEHTGMGIYDGSRFFALTGHAVEAWSSAKIVDCSEQLAILHAEFFAGRERDRRDTSQQQSRAGSGAELSDADLLEKAMGARNGARFKRLWNGDITGYPSQSEADLALATHLAFWSGNDAGRIDSLFQQSGLMRPKWEQREDYRTRTISAAIAATPTPFHPRATAVTPARPGQNSRGGDDPDGEIARACNNGEDSQPSKFREAPDGVYFHSGDRKPQRLCGSLKIVATTRDSEGSNWGWLLRWRDREGRAHEWAMPAAELAGEQIGLRSRLLDGGLFVSPGRGVGALLSEYVQSAQVEAKFLCVSRLGWHGDSFVLPSESIGPADGESVIFQAAEVTDNLLNVSGSLCEWQENVARPCTKNSRLVLAVSSAFAGPLLSLIRAESGGVHLVGATSTGKSTALLVCGSVLGGGGQHGYVNTWNATANGLEITAALHNDLCLPLDEMAQVLPEQAAEVAYLLANGTGKQRMTRQVSSRKRLTWRLLFLSAGEISLADHVRSGGKQTRGGAEVRLLNIEADAGAGMGLFEHLHGAPSPDAFALSLGEAAKRYYGAPLREFLRAVVVDRSLVEQMLRAYRADFIAAHVSPEASGEVARAAARFGLIAAAGELATKYGITGWPEGEARRAIGRCFRDWLAARGTIGGSDLESGIRQVRLFVERHGASRFQVIRHDPESEEAVRDSNQVVRDRAGFRRLSNTGDTEYLILPEAFRSEVCRGYNPRTIAQGLLQRGHLLTQPPSLMHKCRVPEAGLIWVYLLKSTILES
jgi:uncharacterized protein (DUF927 family)